MKSGRTRAEREKGPCKVRKDYQSRKERDGDGSDPQDGIRWYSAGEGRKKLGSDARSSGSFSFLRGHLLTVESDEGRGLTTVSHRRGSCRQHSRGGKEGNLLIILTNSS